MEPPTLKNINLFDILINPKIFLTNEYILLKLKLNKTFQRLMNEILFY